MDIKISKINGKDVSRYKNAETDIKTFFYDDSFEDYNEALFSVQSTINENGIEEKELIIEVEFDIDETTELDKPFYEKMLSELILSQNKVDQEISNIEITFLPPEE